MAVAQVLPPRFLQVDSTQQPDAGVQKGMAGFTWHDALICSCTWITRQPTVTAEECEIAVTRMSLKRNGGVHLTFWAPQNGGFMIQQPMKMDDLGVSPFMETLKWNQRILSYK